MEVDTCTFITIVSTVNFFHNQRVTIVTRLIRESLSEELFFRPWACYNGNPFKNDDSHLSHTELSMTEQFRS